MLTLTEQLLILDPSVAPNPPGENGLLELVHQGSNQFAFEFMTTYTVFDMQDPVNELATSYVNKMVSIVNRVLRADGRSIGQLNRVMVTLIGNSGVTIQQINSASISDWESFILANMKQAFELAGNVLRQEKTAYEAIP